MQDFDFEQALAERRAQETSAWTADPAGSALRQLLKALHVLQPAQRGANVLLLDTTEAPAAPLVEAALEHELQLGRKVYRVDCAGEHGASDVLASLTLQLTGRMPETRFDKLTGYDYFKHLHQHFSRLEVWPRVIVEGIEQPADVYALFGRTRDEIWQLPLQWLVVGNLADVEIYVAPPACSFFEYLVPNRHVISGVYGLNPHPYA